MNPILLLLISCVLFLIGLGGTPFNTYSTQAIGIITYAESYQRPDGNYVCDLRLSYNTNPFTLIHEVPLHTVSKTLYQFGQTPTIYFNPSDPRTISISKYVPSSRSNLYAVILAMAIFFLLQKIPLK